MAKSVKFPTANSLANEVAKRPTSKKKKNEKARILGLIAQGQLSSHQGVSDAAK